MRFDEQSDGSFLRDEEFLRCLSDEILVELKKGFEERTKELVERIDKILEERSKS